MGKVYVNNVKKNIPKWAHSLETAQKFVDEFSSEENLTTLSKEDLLKTHNVCVAMLQEISPIGAARANVLHDDKYADFRRTYNIVEQKIHTILKTCDMIRKGKSKPSILRKKTYDMQRDNKKEDNQYFLNMLRLYEGKINPTDKWYENEARHFLINRYEDVHEYLNAYGRIVRGNIKYAEIVVEGEEDVDEWGYLKFDKKYLPYCLRKFKVDKDNVEYHLYTFNVMNSMDHYDYDGMITDRILLLNEKGIITYRY